MVQFVTGVVKSIPTDYQKPKTVGKANRLIETCPRRLSATAKKVIQTKGECTLDDICWAFISHPDTIASFTQETNPINFVLGIRRRIYDVLGVLSSVGICKRVGAIITALWLVSKISFPFIIIPFSLMFDMFWPKDKFFLLHLKTQSQSPWMLKVAKEPWRYLLFQMLPILIDYPFWGGILFLPMTTDILCSSS